MQSPKQIILTSGPSITEKEIAYVLDSVAHGWSFHRNDYIEKFERKLAKYIDVKYALSVTSGTAALHLAMRVLEIGPGDEVIIPDQTFVSCANVVRWVGATPVFCDVEEYTWCIDPKSMKKAITKRTRAVMPVYTYGQSPRMDEIISIAREHNIFVIEDACPALGSTYKGKKAGSLSDIAAFSFQGAKIVVAGEGGAFITNNKEWFEKAASLRTHGRDRTKTLWYNDVGYMYRMSNIQAALALGQLERIEGFVEKKRKIFQWYKKWLSDIDGLALNTENDWSKSNYWMSSIVLMKKFRLSRDGLRQALLSKKIDTRPFFYPISMLPMYKGSKKVDTPISYKLGHNGINLPSGLSLTEEEVDYITKSIREILTA